MSDEKKISVRIRARETVIYDQEIEITERDLQEFRSALKSPRYRDHADDILADWIDRRDVTDSHDFECDDADILDENDKVIGSLFDDAGDESIDDDEEDEGEDE